MNYGRLVLAAFAGFVVYFVIGFLLFGLLIAKDYLPYSAVYRPADGIKSLFPIGMIATFVAILVMAVLYAKSGWSGRTLTVGARFGALFGIFGVCTFVFHNYIELNIGLRLTLEQAICYFIEWTAVGIVIALLYEPAARKS